MNDPHGDSPVLEWRVRATAAEMEGFLGDLLARRHGRSIPEALLDVHAAAAYLNVHKNTIYEAAKHGKLKYRSVGRLRRFTIADLDEWTSGRS
jgi:excisionase family DNA binding protein